MVFFFQCISFVRADNSVGGLSASDGGRVGGSILNAVAVGGSASNNGGSSNSGNSALLGTITLGSAGGVGGLTDVSDGGLF